MANTRKLRPPDPHAAAARVLESLDGLAGARIVVGLSGGVDSVVLLHVLRELSTAHGFRLAALHVHHGLHPQADDWARFCRRLCRAWKVPLQVCRATVGSPRGRGPEAAARQARYAQFAARRATYVALAHQLDDQAETVLLQLLRGAGTRGAAAMPVVRPLERTRLLRVLLEVPRAAIEAYARRRRLDWMEDPSNRDPRLTRNFVRLRLAPLVEERFPRWREALGRAAVHFARRELSAGDYLRAFLREQGLRAPGSRRLADMLRQLSGAQPHAEVLHDGVRLRKVRGDVLIESAGADRVPASVRRALTGLSESRVPVPELRGALSFRRVLGSGIALDRLAGQVLSVRSREGGERMRLGAARPSRSLKNLFQEAQIGVERRAWLPLLFCGEQLVWIPGIGIDVAFRAQRGEAGVEPRWHPQRRQGLR